MTLFVTPSPFWHDVQGNKATSTVPILSARYQLQVSYKILVGLLSVHSKKNFKLLICKQFMHFELNPCYSRCSTSVASVKNLKQCVKSCTEVTVCLRIWRCRQYSRVQISRICPAVCDFCVGPVFVVMFSYPIPFIRGSQTSFKLTTIFCWFFQRVFSWFSDFVPVWESFSRVRKPWCLWIGG